VVEVDELFVDGGLEPVAGSPERCEERGRWRRLSGSQDIPLGLDGTRPCRERAER